MRTFSQTIDSPLLSLDRLKGATHNFGQKSHIGEGSCGQVYYAELDGQAMAIKKLKPSITQDEVLSQVVFHIRFELSCKINKGNKTNPKQPSSFCINYPKAPSFSLFLMHICSPQEERKKKMILPYNHSNNTCNT